MRQYRGNIHIHSTHSDGTGSVEEIVRAANDAKLDFIILTDHNTLAGRPMEGQHGRTLLLVGSEIGTPMRRHYLAIDAKEGTTGSSKKIDVIRPASTLNFMAHPYVRDSPLLGPGHTPPDLDWDPKRFTGVELWNYCTDWKGAIGGRLSAAYYSLFPDDALSGPDSRLLRQWDTWTQHHQVVAIGGSDAHAKKRRILGVTRTYFPYEMLFQRVNTHILAKEFTGDAKRDIELVHDALREGRCFVANDHVAPSEGFDFRAHNGLDEVVMGAQIMRWDWVRVSVTSPALGLIRVIQNGKTIKEHEGRSCEARIEEDGPVRVEVHRNGPWIFSNPIYVR